MDPENAVEQFLKVGPFAVVGASRDRDKYGNKVLRCYLRHGMDARPVNPRETEVEGIPCAPSLSALDPKPRAISIITPPSVTERVVDEAIALGIRHVWMQPGAESDDAIHKSEAAGLNVIAGGPCILVVLGHRE